MSDLIREQLDTGNVSLNELIAPLVESTARLLVVAAANSEAAVSDLVEIIRNELDEAVVLAVEEWNDNNHTTH